MTPWEKSMREIQAVYRQSKGLPPLETIPVSIRKPEACQSETTSGTGKKIDITNPSYRQYLIEHGRTDLLGDAAIESGRVAYLNDPAAGLRRYERALREFTKQVDEVLSKRGPND